MADLKDIYTEEKLKEIAAAFKVVIATFPTADFLDRVQTDGWTSLSLRQRHERLARVLMTCLGVPFYQAAPVLQEVGTRVQGFSWLFLPDVVALFGLDDFRLSMETLGVLTESSSAEFAIRPFLMQDFSKTFEQMRAWALSENAHHRRLASEGLCPNLPWGKKIPNLEHYRLEIWSILEELKGDRSLYVRKSVANHLNDWTRSHPEEVLDLLEGWQGSSKETGLDYQTGCQELTQGRASTGTCSFWLRESAGPGTGFLVFSFKHKKRGSHGVGLSGQGGASRAPALGVADRFYQTERKAVV